MPQYEPFEQWDMDLPGVPGLIVTLVKVGGHLPGVYVIMQPLCQQLGEIAVWSQITKLREDHDFDGMLREVPYKHPTVGMRTAMGVRRHKAGDWIRGINPKKTRPEYSDRLAEIGKLITETTDRAFFGKVAAHLDPAPKSSLILSPGATLHGSTTETATPGVGRLVIRGEFQFTCEHGTQYLIVIDETGAPRVVSGNEVGE